MKKSWRTTLGGSLGATGVFFVGVPISLLACQVKINGTVLVAFLVSGFVLQGAGIFINGMAGRDNQLSSEQVGADTRCPEGRDGETGSRRAGDGESRSAVDPPAKERSL